MPSKAETISLTDKQKAILHQITRLPTNPVKLMKRAQVVLVAASLSANAKISEQTAMDRKQIRLWKERWINAAAQLLAAEQEGVSEDKLLSMVTEVLSDKPRSGMPKVFCEEQVGKIVALAQGIPLHQQIEELSEHGENKQVADEAVRQGIVPNISPRTVGRFLKRRNAVAV